MIDLVLALPLLAGHPLPPVEPQAATERVAIRAGTVYLVEGDQVLTGGATILVEDGRIAAIGADIAVPAGAVLIDYGPDAVIMPGLVAADTSLAQGAASPRTADPTLRALDGFDLFSRNAGSLAAGVTTAYISPNPVRLVGGQGALVKLGPQGEEHRDHRVLRDPAAIDGTITRFARSVRGYWEPPVPPTVDVGMGDTIPQLPQTTMGAILALEELITAVKSGVEEERYGPHTASRLAALMKKRIPWNMRADSQTEIRALLRFASAEMLPLTLVGAAESGELADEIAAAGAKVIYTVPVVAQARGTDRGKAEEVTWPALDGSSKLARAGVPVAISCANPRDLRLAVALASSGGLDRALALRAITLTPAEIYGASERVGSLAPGKDADLVVLNGDPLAVTSSVLATWIDGELAWKGGTSSATVLEVDELHVGDGEVLRPGQVLLLDGKIAEVGRRVSHPRGATVVRGAAAMPGMVDALGHLGLEGSGRVPNPDFDLATIVGPGDDTDRRVARRGVTTVVLSPRGFGGAGTPLMAYKPAAEDFDELVVEGTVALRMRWYESMRSRSGANVTQVLDKAAQYRQSWAEYAEKLAAWSAPAAEPQRPKANLPPEEDEKGEEEKSENGNGNGNGNGDEDKDDKKKKKKKEEDPFPVTGVWSGEIVRGEHDEPSPIRLQLSRTDTAVVGSIRCEALFEGLVRVSGTWIEKQLELTCESVLGGATLTAEIDEGTLKAVLTVAGDALEFEAQRTSREYVVAGRPELRRTAAEKADEPKDKPNPPKLDAKLEPLRRAMDGDGTVVVEVEREDDILRCVETFERYGIRPVLYGASGAQHVLDRIAGRVAGILPPTAILVSDPGQGTEYRNVYAQIQNAGIPVAFASQAEEGAIDLPLMAAFAVSQGMSPEGALRALTGDAAAMLSIGDRVGLLRVGLDADVLLLDGSPLEPSTRVLRTWLNGEEVR